MRKKPLHTYKIYVYCIMTTREILKLLYKDGWFVYEQNGSHIQLKHPLKKGHVTVPNHKDNLKKSTLHSTFTQADLK